MANLKIDASPQEVAHGAHVTLTARKGDKDFEGAIVWSVVDHADRDVGRLHGQHDNPARWEPTHDTRAGTYTVRAVDPEDRVRFDTTQIEVVRLPLAAGDVVPIRVELERTVAPPTTAAAQWELIRQGAEQLSFRRFKAFMDHVFCGARLPREFFDSDAAYEQAKAGATNGSGAAHGWDPKAANVPATLPFPDMQSYKRLRGAAEVFMMISCGVDLHKTPQTDVRRLELDLRQRLEGYEGVALPKLWDRYLLLGNGDRFSPYMYLIREKLGDVALTTTDSPDGVALCNSILREKLLRPCLIELIWSYWHEEGMLVQTMNAISLRFQNRRGPTATDPLANLTIDPLRPLGNLLWGYIQDEQHRLTIARRAYEYDHEYGIGLVGSAVPRIQGADTRSAFLGAFHTLLHRASLFYKEDDDTTVIADAFPVLNALREVHLLLAEGAENQYGDLPWTARLEMLIEQWLLARPEFREFLPARPMVVYPELWMERVDAMKKLQGWSDTSVRYFQELAVFGEQLLLSIRYGNWSEIFDRNQAASWARFWRQEVQWYVHAYETVTGVDLSADMVDTRQAEQARERALQPGLHLQRRLQEQRQARAGLPQPAAAPQPAALPQPPVRA